MRDMPQLLMLDRSGIPIDWVNYETYVQQSWKGNILWEYGDLALELRGGVNSITGIQSKIFASSIFAINGKKSKHFYESFAKIPLSKKHNTDLFNRDRRICGYCGNLFKIKDLSRDHIHPQSKGGKDEWENVVTSCKSCNQQKDDMTLSQWGKELLYIPYTPNRAEKLILENRNILVDQMEFLLQQVPKDSKLLNRQ